MIHYVPVVEKIFPIGTGIEPAVSGLAIHSLNQGPYSRGGKRTGIQHDHAEGDGFDSRSVQDLFVEEISLTSLGIEYLRACHTIYTCKMEDEEQRLIIMRKAFQMFDTTKCGFIDTVKISTILNTLGQQFDEGELQDLIDEEDPEETGRVNFDQFANIASNFLIEDEDSEAIQQELKEAFRMYDREGNGYITTSWPTADRGGSDDLECWLPKNFIRPLVLSARMRGVVIVVVRGSCACMDFTLKEILAALDDKLTNDDLDGMINEIDADGSGTVDFDEFMEMMTGE
ncbi:hypothetical protein RP20_CCG013470 [Aedes albopictus]|nr:hypothetical protein RP20_CCG013470 [Aedes albopictus]